ncbi:hypothetical protein G9A89_001635 [Geosiphon pyriformis]|nr:hypothetical protein G9A89_001635 [Geosiphon pyriformis]
MQKISETTFTQDPEKKEDENETRISEEKRLSLLKMKRASGSSFITSFSFDEESSQSKKKPFPPCKLKTISLRTSKRVSPIRSPQNAQLDPSSTEYLKQWGTFGVQYKVGESTNSFDDSPNDIILTLPLIQDNFEDQYDELPAYQGSLLCKDLPRVFPKKKTPKCQCCEGKYVLHPTTCLRILCLYLRSRFRLKTTTGPQMTKTISLTALFFLPIITGVASVIDFKRTLLSRNSYRSMFNFFFHINMFSFQLGRLWLSIMNNSVALHTIFLKTSSISTAQKSL